MEFEARRIADVEHGELAAELAISQLLLISRALMSDPVVGFSVASSSSYSRCNQLLWIARAAFDLQFYDATDSESRYFNFRTIRGLENLPKT